MVGSPVTLRKQKEHILWSEKLTVNIVRKNMHQMGTQDTPDETSWKYCLNYDFVCKPRRILRQHIDVNMLLKLSVKIVIGSLHQIQI